MNTESISDTSDLCTALHTDGEETNSQEIEADVGDIGKNKGSSCWDDISDEFLIKHIMLRKKSDDDHTSKKKNEECCANCGKDDAHNICNKCEEVKYCNASCKKEHRSKHKKQCERHVAELYDEKLFKLPTYEDCPICFLPLPSLNTWKRYMPCCGKIICAGCHDTFKKIELGKRGSSSCVFCRVPAPKTMEEAIERMKKRAAVNEAEAVHNLGYYYSIGERGFTRNMDKALEHWHRAGDLGCSTSYYYLGNAYMSGNGVEFNMEKANQYYGLAAMGGSAKARHNLGCSERSMGNIERAVRHFIIGASCGLDISLKQIQKLYSNGHVTKEDYTKSLRAYQAYLAEIKSEQRDKAATNTVYHY